jgi:hypothetical protein
MCWCSVVISDICKTYCARCRNEEKQTPIVISQCTVFFTVVNGQRRGEYPHHIFIPWAIFNRPESLLHCVSESIRILSANQQEIVCHCRDM